MVEGKQGKLNALMLFVMIFLGVIAIIMMGIFVFGANLIESSFLSIGANVQIGDQNFTTVYNETLGQGIDAFQNGADNYGLALLLGMVLVMIISSFTFKERNKAWIVAEFVILIIAMILAVSIQRSYDIFINSSANLFDIYSNDLIRSSKFILNLPLIIPIVWAFIVIITYGIFKRKGDTVATSDVGF